MRTSSNMGFARGNNKGISYLRALGINRIFVINNDTLLEDNRYLQKLTSLKYGPNIGMVGTTIVSADGTDHNPQPVMHADRRTVSDSIWLFFFRLHHKLVKLGLLSQRFKEPWQNRNSKKLRPSREMLHGAAILFTEHFFEQYDGFYPGTFLFMEEDILALLCQRTEIRQLYVPSLSMTHKEDGSSKMAWNGRNQDIVRTNYSNKSLEKYDYLQTLSTKILQKHFCFSDNDFISDVV